MEFNDFISRAYLERQLVMFVEPDRLWDGLRELNGASRIPYWLLVPPIFFNQQLIGLGVNVLINIYKRAKAVGMNIQTLPSSWASHLDLPPGHPRHRVLYAAHPAKPDRYIPVSEFHRSNFEHKFAEIQSILMHLGATEIIVEHVQGWGKEYASTISVDKAEIRTGFNHSTGSKSLFEASFAGSDSPSLPDNLVWYPYEPTWKEIAEGRLKFGLENFSLQLCYHDDYGVNAKLKAKAMRSGFDLGGGFEKHESTTWTIKGTFRVRKESVSEPD